MEVNHRARTPSYECATRASQRRASNATKTAVFVRKEVYFLCAPGFSPQMVAHEFTCLFIRRNRYNAAVISNIMVTPEPPRDIELPKRYISVDVESSGRTPGRYSMLSIGACVVGDRSKTFYRELKPISDEYITGAMRVGCRGLECIARESEDDPRYDPFGAEFQPALVLARLRNRGVLPGTAMQRFDMWVRDVTAGFRPVLAASPTGFDAMFVHWYFDNFYDGENPFVFGGEDIGSVYKGFVRDMGASMSALSIPREGTHHNALDDAIHQAKEMEEILRLMSQKE